MKSLEGTDESSLSDGAARFSIRTAIKQFLLLKSIFHLFQNKLILKFVIKESLFIVLGIFRDIWGY